MSNVNLNSVTQSGNTGRVDTWPKMGIPVAIVLVPVGTIIPASAMVSQAAFNTYMAANFVPTVSLPNANTRQFRWFAFTNLDKFTNETKKKTTEDTGIYQFDIYNFPSKFSFRYMQAMGNFIEAYNFSNCQGQYDYHIIDSLGNWWGTYDTTGAGGLAPYTNLQFFVENWDPETVSTDTAQMITISMANVEQMHKFFNIYQAGTIPNAIVMLENAVVTDVSATLGTPLSITATTDIVVTVKIGEGSQDFVQAYMSALTAPCFKATNLTTAASLTIASIQKGVIVVAGQTYYYVWITLSAAPTATNLVQVTLATPSALNVIIPNANVVVEVINPVANGQNAAVHTF